MVFNREWDATCPREWARWEADGKIWVVQDIRPEDDEAAVQMMVDHWLTDEPVCFTAGILNDPPSLSTFTQGWRQILAQRMSLGCYLETEVQKTLVGLNVCCVTEKGAEPELKIEGSAAINVFGVMKYLESKNDPYDSLGLDKVLKAYGLVVAREFRGFKLGSKILAAREPLCKSQGVKGTVTMFTGPASQKSAINCGFTTLSDTTWSELADSGLDFPREDRFIKFMSRKYE